MYSCKPAGVDTVPTAWLRFRGRVLDRILAPALVCFLAAPLVAICAAQLLVEGPPAVVRLPRVGRRGEGFQIYKFRTMVRSANGPKITAAGDRRITRLGRWLRVYRLDELLQIANVLAGHMALIGPRPEDPAFVDFREAPWQRILSVRPGITGLTQVVVRDRESNKLGVIDDPVEVARLYRAKVLPAKLACDLWYLDHASPALDASILYATIAPRSRACRRLVERLERAVPALELFNDLHVIQDPVAQEEARS